MQDDLAVQLPEIRRVLDAYGIPILELPGYEADDVIGTLAVRAVQAEYDVVIVTAEKTCCSWWVRCARLSHGPRAFPG